MDKFKKVAVTALGGALAASTANAVDVSVSGGSEIGWGTGSSNYSASKASAFGAGTGVSFSASGDLDNGWTVSTTHATSNAFALTSSNITVDTGSMGKVRFNRVGAASTNANDDVLPTAWEEANDNADTSIRGTALADNMSSGSISYISPSIDLAGGSVSFTLDYDPAASSGGGNPGATIARTANTGNGVAYGTTVSMGPLTAHAGYAVTETTLSKDESDGKNMMVQLIADMGAISIGAGEWEMNGKDGATDYSTTGIGVSFNVNDDLSVSYGELEDTKEADSATAAVATEVTSIQVAYSMGSMAVKAKRVETDNPYNQTTNNSTEHTELSVSFSF
jgi:hypothetical protein